MCRQSRARFTSDELRSRPWGRKSKLDQESSSLPVSSRHSFAKGKEQVYYWHIYYFQWKTPDGRRSYPYEVCEDSRAHQGYLKASLE